MANIEVKNLKGNTKPSCSCTSFLCHWENYAGKATVCSRLGCSEKKDLVGAHIIKCHGNASSIRYIVPLCYKCNHSSKIICFKLKSGVKLVPVTLRLKCKPC